MWDTLFGADAKLDLVPYVCVAMLLRIRAPLLLSDYAGCFSHLLRFPSACEAAREPAAQEESTKGLAPALLVQQACALRDEPTGAAARLAQENEAILGLAVKVSPALIASNAPSSSRPKRQQTPRTIATGRPSGQRSGLASAGLGPPGSSSPDIAGEPQSSYLPEGITDLARGIYSRADAFGVNRALVNAMGNVQRTVGAYAAAGFAGPGRSATANDGFPPALERVPRASASLNGVARPSVAPQDPARELAALKASNAAMGAAVAACVDVFERQWVTMGTPSGGAAPQAEEQLTGAQVGVLMSLTALKHTRDVLLGIAPEFDSATVHVPQLREAIPQALPSPPASRIVPAQVQPRSPEAVQPASAPAHGGARQAQPPYQPRVARGPAAADPLAQASPGSFSHARPSPPPRTQLSGSAPAAVDSSSAPSAKTSPVTSTTHNARAFARSPDSTMPPQLPASSASAHVAELPSAPPIRPSNLQPSSQRSVSPSDPLSPPLRSATFDSRRLSRPGLSCNTFSEAPVERSAPAPQPPRQATAPAQPPPTRVSVVHSPLDPLSQFVSPRHEQHGAAPTTSLRSGSLPGSDPLGAS
jgi:TBC1 domain family protein 5